MNEVTAFSAAMGNEVIVICIDPPNAEELSIQDTSYAMPQVGSHIGGS